MKKYLKWSHFCQFVITKYKFEAAEMLIPEQLLNMTVQQ